MESFGNLFANVLMFALLMIPGYAMGKCRRMDGGAVQSFGNLLSHVAMPALVFFKLLETELSSVSVTGLVCSSLMPVAVVGVGSLLAVPIFRWQCAPERNPVSRFCAVYSNCGFLGIPLASAMFPHHPEITVYVSLFNVVNTFLLLSFGARTLSGRRGRLSVWRVLLRPVTVCMVLGTVLSCLGVGRRLPMLVTYASTLAQLTTPLSMTVLGYQLSGLHIGRLIKLPAVYLTAAVKLLLSPILALGILALCSLIPVVSVEPELAAGMCIATAVSTAASAPALVAQYGLDGEYAAALTLGNTLLCVITLPLVYCLFGAVFGL